MRAIARIAVVAFVVAFLFAPARVLGQQDEWQEYGGKWVLVDSRMLPNGSFRMWVRTVHPDSTGATTLIEADCGNIRVRMLNAVAASDSGWAYPEPGSWPRIIMDNRCIRVNRVKEGSDELSAPPRAPGTEWVLITEKLGGERLLVKRGSLKRVRGDTVRAVSRLVNAELDMTRTWEADCVGRTMRTVAYSIHAKSKGRDVSSDKPGSWSDVNELNEPMLETVCRALRP